MSDETSETTIEVKGLQVKGKPRFASVQETADDNDKN